MLQPPPRRRHWPAPFQARHEVLRRASVTIAADAAITAYFKHFELLLYRRRTAFQVTITPRAAGDAYLPLHDATSISRDAAASPPWAFISAAASAAPPDARWLPPRFCSSRHDAHGRGGDDDSAYILIAGHAARRCCCMLRQMARRHTFMLKTLMLHEIRRRIFAAQEDDDIDAAFYAGFIRHAFRPLFFTRP